MILNWPAATPPSFQIQPNIESSLITIAHDAIRSQVTGTSFSPSGHTPPKAVFVTIERDGVIRGCRGDLLPRGRSLEAEVAQAARDAAAHDPRYRPVRATELDKILVTVTVVEGQRNLDDISSLTPDEGLVLKAGNRTGIVLPWEGKDPETRLRWAYKKAGVPEKSAVSLSVLIAERFRG